MGVGALVILLFLSCYQTLIPASFRPRENPKPRFLSESVESRVSPECPLVFETPDVIIFRSKYVQPADPSSSHVIYSDTFNLEAGAIKLQILVGQNVELVIDEFCEKYQLGLACDNVRRRVAAVEYEKLANLSPCTYIYYKIYLCKAHMKVLNDEENELSDELHRLRDVRSPRSASVRRQLEQRYFSSRIEWKALAANLTSLTQEAEASYPAGCRPCEAVVGHLRRRVPDLHPRFPSHRSPYPNEPLTTWITDYASSKQLYCGAKHLVRLTGARLELVSDKDIHTAVVGEPVTLYLKVTREGVADVDADVNVDDDVDDDSDSDGDGGVDWRVSVFVRLRGPSLLVASVERETSTLYRVTYTPYDPGEYSLDIKLLWLDGHSDPPGGTDMYVGPRINLSAELMAFDMLGHFFPKESKAAHYQTVAHAFHNCAEQANVAGSPLVINVQPGDPRQGYGLCTHAQHPGRWLLVDEHCVAPGHDLPVCVGSPSFLDSDPELDRRGSMVWVWVPYECVYPLPSLAQVAQCFSSQRLHTMHFFGDSLALELYFEVLAFFGDPYLYPANDTHASQVYLHNSTYVSIGDVAYTVMHRVWANHVSLGRGHMHPDDRGLWNMIFSSHSDVIVFGIALAHLLLAYTFEQFKVYMDDVLAIYFAHHAGLMRRGAVVVAYTGPVHGYGSHWRYITYDRAQMFKTHAVSVLNEAGIAVVDAWATSDGRPESNHDQLHFKGGVPRMAAMLLFNLLCGASAGPGVTCPVG